MEGRQAGQSVSFQKTRALHPRAKPYDALSFEQGKSSFNMAHLHFDFHFQWKAFVMCHCFR